MNEFKTSDIPISKELEVENYTDIKQEGNMTIKEVRGFWDDIFSEKDNTIEKENPREEKIEGTTYFYDDNGNLYRKDNELIPNCEYIMNGYEYKTDDLGRIISAEGKLHMKKHEGKLSIKDDLSDIGKGDELPGHDDRGHIIGDQFDGSNRLENMVPQDAKINRKEFRNLENSLASEVKAGQDVRVKVEPIYEGDSRRPDAICYNYSINGERNIIIFPNGKE